MSQRTASTPVVTRAAFRLPSLRSVADFVLVLAGIGFATGTNFVLKVFIGRRLGADALGIFAMCYAVLVTSSILADLGIRYSMVNLAARKQKESPGRVGSYVAAGLLIKLTSGAVGLILGWVLADQIAVLVFRKPEVAPFLKIASVGVFLWTVWDGLEGALHIQQRFSTASGLRILMDAGRLVCFFGLFFYAGGRWLTMDRYMWLHYACIGLSVVGGAVVVALVIKPTRAGLGEHIRELLGFSRGVFFYRSCTMVLLLLDSLALTRYGQLADVGRYEAAKGLAYALLLVSETLGMVLLPKVNLIESLEHIKDLLRRFGVLFVVLTVAAVVWLSVAGRFLVLFGPAFTSVSVVHTFQILVVATLFTIPSTVLGTVLLSLHRPGALGKIAAFQVLTGVVLFPFTCVQGGIVGTAMTSAFLQLMGAVLMGVVLRREIAGKTSHPALAG